MNKSPDELPAHGVGGTGPTIEASMSAVSWPAIISGAVVAASSSLILVALGSGLGLAIVRGIVQAHGGTVAVISNPGQGSTFTLEIPK